MQSCVTVGGKWKLKMAKFYILVWAKQVHEKWSVQIRILRQKSLKVWLTSCSFDIHSPCNLFRTDRPLKIFLWKVVTAEFPFEITVQAFRGKLANYPIFKLTVRHRRSVIEPCFTFLPKSLTEISRNLYARKYLDKSGIGEVWLKIPRVEAKFEIWSVSHKKHRPANSHFYDWILHGYGNCHSLNCPLIVSFIILTFGQIAQFCSKTIKFHLVVWASDPVDGTGWWWRKALEINPFSEKATQKLDQSAFSMDLFFVAKMFPPLNIIFNGKSQSKSFLSSESQHIFNPHPQSTSVNRAIILNLGYQ